MNHSLPSGIGSSAVPRAVSETAHAPRVGIIIPACNEEACIGQVLEELLALVHPGEYVVAVGVNNSSDRTAEIARQYPVIVTETRLRGYGYGCEQAVDVLTKSVPSVSAYIFFAGDGASDPRDVAPLATASEQGFRMVLGARTTRWRNWRAMRFSHVVANLALGVWCGLLTGRRFTDLAPLRLIQRDLFEALALREMTFGWTVEAQVGAAILGETICEIPATERSRMAGEQKVSGVTWRRTFSIGCRIIAAGWRARVRYRRRLSLRAGVRAIEPVARAAAQA